MEADLRVLWGQLIDLLITREDLVQSYLIEEEIPQYSLDEMIDHFMKGTGKKPKPRYKRQTPVWRVHPGIDGPEWEYIANCINSLDIFEYSLSAKEVEDFLKGKLEHTINAKENNRVACFLCHLSLSGLLCFKWQHLFGAEQKILSSKDGRPLTSKRLRDSWNEVKDYDYDHYSRIRRLISAIARMVKDKT